MAALDIDTTLNEVVAIVASSPYSRLPVYRDVAGQRRRRAAHPDLVQWFVDGSKESTLSALIRPISAVHESVTADRVLRHYRERRAHQALVVDEFGGTAGVITLEDVLSELVGEVGDEFKGGAPVADLLPDGRIRLPEPWPSTNAEEEPRRRGDRRHHCRGLVTAALGDLPEPGDKATIGRSSSRWSGWLTARWNPCCKTCLP